MHKLVSIDPSSEAQWGRLVLSWALGESKVAGMSSDQVRRPESRQELIDQCQLAGIKIANQPGEPGIFIPERIANVQCVQATLDTLILKLPEKELYAEAKLLLRDTATYPVPSFYITLFDPDGMTIEDMHRLQECRIGDYSMSHCV